MGLVSESSAMARAMEDAAGAASALLPAGSPATPNIRSYTTRFWILFQVWC